MTEEELQNIADRVIDKLRKDSVRIEQLENTNALEGTDLVELDRGRNVNLEDLRAFLGAGTRIDVIRRKDMEAIPTDENVFSALRTLYEISKNKEEFKNIFLRRDIPEFVRYLMTFEDGAVFGKNGFAGGLTGFGAKIDKNGNAEMESLILRRFLEVPELHFNRTEIIVGNSWRAAGGIFEKTEADGPDSMLGMGWLKLEEGEYGQIEVGDICMGIFHSEDPAVNSSLDADDGRGNFQFAGFYTCYFTITEVIGADHKQFRYQLRPVSENWSMTFHPSPSMSFVCYGSFDENRKERQCTEYSTRTYTRYLVNQNTWEIGRQNIAMQTGDLSNLNMFGLQMKGYSTYLNSVYFTGEVTQTKADGTPVKGANDRGEWAPGTKADYYDRFSHKGGLWLCVAEAGTTTEPAEEDPAWLCQVRPGDSLQSYSRWHSEKCPYPTNAMLNMAGRVVISKEETSEPPFPLLTDKDGRYIVQSDGSYLIASYDLNPQWNLIFDESSIKDGADGDSVELRYSADKANWHADYQTGDTYMQMRVGDNPWSQPMLFVGEDGANGKDAPYSSFEFAVNESLTDAPTSGWTDAPPAVGNGQYLWMRTGVVVPPATAPDHWTVARIKGDVGDKGDGYTQLGQWKSGMLVRVMGVVSMGGSSFVAKVATRQPPLFTLVDKAGNRLTDKDGGYLLTGEKNLAEYDVFAEKGEHGSDGLDGIPGTDGADGKTYYTWLRYADDAQGGGMSNLPDGKKYLGLAYNKETPTESDNPQDYMWSEIKGEQGVPGENGYTWIKYSDYPNGKDASGQPAMYQQPNDNTRYIGIAPNKDTIEELDNNDPTVYTWSKFRGEDGEGFTQMGQWHTGMLVPKMGVVSMGGGSYVAKVATRNPPLFCLTDKAGNRIVQKNGSYILNGQKNTAEYDEWSSKGEPGKDGEDGKDGVDGSQGIPGVNGCNTRVSEWRSGVAYVNESASSKEVKFIDVVFVRNTSAATGWDAYICRKSHTSSSSITYTDTTYWEKTSQNVTAIFASIILAKNAVIDLLQGNSIIIQTDGGTATAGMTGSDAAGGIRLWAGSTFGNRGAAPFRVDKYGNLYATQASITGEVNATSGTFNNVEINGILRCPFTEPAAQIISFPYEDTIYDYLIEGLLEGHKSNFIIEATENVRHRVVLPDNTKYSGTNIVIYNSGTKDIDINMGSSEMKLSPGRTGIFYGIGTTTRFVKWIFDYII